MLGDFDQIDLGGFSALVLSPGVPLTHPEPHWTVRKAKAAGIEVIGDTEVFQRQIAGTGARLVAITGTNGKSTTTALIGHLFKSAGRDVEVGGNIGRAVFLLGAPRPERIYVLELSSFQIDLMPCLAPDAGVLLNLSPDHLERHGTMAHYAAVKARMFAHQGHDQTAIIGVDDEWGEGIAAAERPVARGENFGRAGARRRGFRRLTAYYGSARLATTRRRSIFIPCGPSRGPTTGRTPARPMRQRAASV